MSKYDDWSQYAVRIVVNTVAHPLEYGKLLIQIGYEPFPPKPAKSLFGKPVLKLPNIFEYVRHIKSIDGISGCYRGLVPKLCGNCLGAFASQKVLESTRLAEGIEDDEEDEDVITIEKKREREREKFIQILTKDAVTRSAAIIVSHPFHVIAIRMMAQFVGGEAVYTGIGRSIREVYRENGIGGFFSGLVPRLAGDLLSLTLASSLAFAVNVYLIEDNELKTYSAATMSFIASTLTYPFQVVANCMAVSGSGLVAGQPPHMPVYTSWVDCWSHLSRTNNLKRGASLLLRYYQGPQVVINGRAVPVNQEDFSMYKSK